MHISVPVLYLNFLEVVVGLHGNVDISYRKIASSNTSRLEAHAGFFRLLKKGIFDPYVLSPFDKKLISKLVTHVRARDYMVFGTSLSCQPNPTQIANSIS